MPIDMSSKRTLVFLAIFYGLMKAMEKVAIGESLSRVVLFFLGSAVVGTLVTMGIVWVVLAILGKWHLHTTVTNWVMLFGSCLAIFTGLILSV